MLLDFDVRWMVKLKVSDEVMLTVYRVLEALACGSGVGMGTS